MLLLSFAFAFLTAAPQTGHVSGGVVEAGTNTPLSGARVLVLPLGRPTFPPGPPPQTITDENGRFEFDGLSPGRYRIDAQKAGFASSSPIDPSAFRTFELAAGQSRDGLNVPLQKGAVIAGQILDPSSGEPLVGAMVAAMRRLGASGAPAGVVPSDLPRLVPAGQSAQTNDLGEFRIFGLPPGEYFVAASRPPNFGFATSSTPTAGGTSITAAAPTTAAVFTFYPGTADASAAQPVTIAAGQVATGIVIRLLTAQTYQVSGTVVDENGAPVAGAMVMLRGDPRTGFGPWPAGSGRSDPSGTFVIGGVTPGSYMATASVPITIASPGAGSGATAFYSSVTTSSGPPTPRSQLDIMVHDANVEGLTIVVQRPQ